MLRKILRKSQPNFQHFVGKIEAQTKRGFDGDKNNLTILISYNIDILHYSLHKYL